MPTFHRSNMHCIRENAKLASELLPLSICAKERTFFTLLKHVPGSCVNVEGEGEHTRWM